MGSIEGERGTENPNQQTSPVSNVSARVSDFLSHVDKQEKDQKGWCREHIWSLLWWGSIPFQRFFFSLLCNYLLRKDYR